jgi:hypothetical protein
MAQNLYTNLTINGFSSDTQSLVVKTGSTDIFVVNYNGTGGIINNFGVGTNSPSVKLHVKGNSGLFIESDDSGYGSFKFRPYSTQQNYSSIQSSDGAELRWGGALGSPLGYNEFAFYNTANTTVKLAINNLNPTATLHAVGERADTGNKTFRLENSASTFVYDVYDNGAFEWTTYDNIYPQFKTTGSIFQMSWDAGSQFYNIYKIGTAFKTTFFVNAALAYWQQQPNIDWGIIDSNSNAQFWFDEDVRRVGIGIQTPSSKLHVVGNRADSSGQSLIVNNSASTSSFAINDKGQVTISTIQDSGAGPGGESLKISSTVGDANIFINSSGGSNVYPSLQLGYASTAYSDISGAGSNLLIRANGNLEFRNRLTNSRNFLLDTSSNFLFTNDPTGTQTASSRLQINGSTTNSSAFTFKVADSAQTVHFAVRNDGNIGIGAATTSPQEKLHLSGGTIRINTLNGTEGAGKFAISDANGSISFSSATALGLSTSSGTVGGTGTPGYIAKWSSTSALTDSLISESGTGVTVNGSIYIYGNVDVLGTATTFNTTTVQTSDNNITLNLSGSHVSAFGGGITVLSGKTDNTSSTWTIDSSGHWSANTSAITINGGRITSDGNAGLNNTFWAAASAPPVISVGTRNLFVGNNDTGTFTATGSFNNLLGCFQGVGLSSGVGNTFIGNYNTIAGVTSGSYNIGINSNFPTNVSLALAIGSTAPQSNSVSIGSTGTWYGDWFLGLGKDATHAFGAVNMNWYASSVSEGDTDKAATIPIWRFNGSRATGNGSNGDIRLAVALSGASGALWNSTADKVTVKGNSGYVGINQNSPTSQLHVTGDFKLENSSYGAGKFAISDANGVISFSSTTSLSLGSVNKYATSLTTPGASVTNTITHNLGTTDITVTLWLESTGDMTSAKITNRLSNSVDVIFASAPGENVRVVVTG